MPHVRGSVAKFNLTNAAVLEHRIAIHFPQYKHGKDARGIIPKGKPDNSSLSLEHYPSRARRALRALIELAKTGGYVCAEYYGQHKSMLGFIDPDSEIQLLRGRWGSKKHEGRKAILKTLRLRKVNFVNPSEFANLHEAVAKSWDDKHHRAPVPVRRRQQLAVENTDAAGLLVPVIGEMQRFDRHSVFQSASRAQLGPAPHVEERLGDESRDQDW